MPQKHSKLWFKELKTMAPKRLKNHTDHKRTSQYFKLILRTTLYLFLSFQIKVPLFQIRLLSFQLELPSIQENILSFQEIVLPNQVKVLSNRNHLQGKKCKLAGEIDEPARLFRKSRNFRRKKAHYHPIFAQKILHFGKNHFQSRHKDASFRFFNRLNRSQQAIFY